MFLICFKLTFIIIGKEFENICDLIAEVSTVLCINVCVDIYFLSFDFSLNFVSLFALKYNTPRAHRFIEVEQLYPISEYI